MSTDHTVTIHVAAVAVPRLVSNNSPALAARLALADFEGEFGRLPPGSYVEVAWRADDEGRPGSCRYDDLAAIRRAMPGAEPAPALAPPAQPAGYGEWLSTLDPYEPPSPSAAWAAALAWAAGLAEAAGCLCLEMVRSDPVGWDGRFVPLEPLEGEAGTEWLEAWDGRASHDANGDPIVDVHDPRCPIALAAAIRAGRP